MPPKPATETKDAAQRRLTAELLRLGETIDQQEPGSRRLELLRRQADLGDQRAALYSKRR